MALEGASDMVKPWILCAFLLASVPGCGGAMWAASPPVAGGIWAGSHVASGGVGALNASMTPEERVNAAVGNDCATWSFFGSVPTCTGWTPDAGPLSINSVYSADPQEASDVGNPVGYEDCVYRKVMRGAAGAC
jgi:hypothetical protein